MTDIAKYIDQTLLAQDATGEEVKAFCKAAREYGFYAVCVQPCRVADAYSVLKGSDVKIAAVVGFPCGSTYTEVKALEAGKCLEDGANEIDMVINIGALREGNLNLVREDIRLVADVAHNHNAILKVIIETGLLTDSEKQLACKIAAEAGADFVKTSTGMAKGSKPATVEDVRLMHEAVGHLGLKVKASGGIRDYETAMAMLTAGADRIGTSSGVEIVRQEAAEKV
jgi:deoxyribose-phosphate aldolase